MVTTVLLDAPLASGPYARGGAVEPGQRAVSCKAPESKTAIFYMNGMNTTFDAAALSVIELRNKFSAAGARGTEETVFLLAYNRTEGFLRDFAESVIQRLGENSREAANASSFDIIHAILFGRDSSAVQMVMNEVAALLPSTKWPSATANATLAADLGKQELAIRSKLLEGNRVLLVAHSQGNFFAVETLRAFGALGSREPNSTDSASAIYKGSLGAVSVATPSGERIEPYINYHRDLVINSVRLANPNTPEPNCRNNDSSGDDWLHHGFVESYLNGDDCGDKVIGGMKTVLGSLSFPQKRATTGIITITLTWGSQPDVDLHVKEPNGKHVYYRKKRGRSGYLDVDDTNGRGPEHYFVSCDKLEAGTYSFGLNYFAGRRREEAHVQVQAGLEVKHFTKKLKRARGRSGDRRWSPLGKVVVSGDAANREFIFSID